MPKCRRCGQFGWFRSLSLDGLCKVCQAKLEEIKKTVEKFQAVAQDFDSVVQGEERATTITYGGSNKREISLQETQLNGHLSLSAYIGQEAIIRDLKARIDANKQHSRRLPHILLCGPSEMGKATLSDAIAHEMERNIKHSDAYVIERHGDLAALLTNLEEAELLLIERIESLREPLVEVLVSAIEDLTIDLPVAGRQLKLDIKKFTLIGTTSRPSQVDKRLRRWMVVYDLVPYTVREIGQIVQ